MICPVCNKEKDDVRLVMSVACMEWDGKTNVFNKMCGVCEVSERIFAKEQKEKYESYRSDNEN